ncbi:MAG: DNA polymerase III subunit gamma/tau [Armatimonadetes bacterium]|nr:DNA polymerase III subunit gamma/tau [Armatimonadota bacterium]
MSHIALYRKYRSRTFNDVIGQEHITRTLQNAIRQGKISHAYLFCGTRGTGKTTTARLLAKALNCEKGPTDEPCNECQACLSITDGSAVDIMEMDAASHRGIDDIRDIRENVKFPPMALRYKVFIIDEAHQLTREGKDAFLKTLEEPPAHAVFILATTEPHNIPITIRSRCQQFDFRRGSLSDIRSRMKFVCEAEGIEADDEALDIIAMDADGSYRDSLSLLEQVLSYSEGRLTPNDVYMVLGTVTQDFLFRMGDMIADGDEAGAFEAAREAAESGKDLRQLMRSMADHFRNLMYASVTSGKESRAFGEDVLTRLREQVEKLDKSRLLALIELFSDAEQKARFAERHKLLLEMALLRAIETATGSPPASAQPAQSRTPVPRPTAPIKPAPKPKPAEQPTMTVDRPKEPAGDRKMPDFDAIRRKWNVVLQTMKAISVPAHALVSEAIPADIRNGSLVLQFKHVAHCEILQSEPNKAKQRAVQTAIERVFGYANMGIICEPARHEAPEPEPEPEPEFGTPELPGASDDSALQDVLDIFNGKIVDD